MLKRLPILLVLLLALSCSRSPKQYVDWLYAYMPLPDSLHHDRGWWAANVVKTLQVRRRMHWGIPEREFRHFVLPLRVNNESLDDFRLVYADTLCARVKGMNLTQAALEINHWCHEQASYEPSDARTSSPMATARRGLGRCGEESVLTVAALRAAGIPARQVYTPRWAHTDDNHAWVEVYTGRGWHFLGACEPAPTLDNAWFNGPVSRAMLLHTKVYGDYKGPEDVIQRTPCYTEINVIRGYVPARKTKVTVLEENPASIGQITADSATVGFTIYNYGEFYTVATYQTGQDGTASLDTGLGDMLVWARKEDRFGFAVASSEHVTITLSHRLGQRFSADLSIVPPPENPIPTHSNARMEEENARRLAEEDAIRASHPHNNPDVDAFLADYGNVGRTVLDMLTPKDRGDVTLDVLEDAVEGSATILASGKAFPYNPDILKYVAGQRIELEPLRPYRWDILVSGIGDKINTPWEAAAWVRGNIRLAEGRNPQNLRLSPSAVWKSRMADRLGRDIFYIALCRTLGFPARINPVTGRTEYSPGDGWLDIDLDNPGPRPEAHPAKAPAAINGSFVPAPIGRCSLQANLTLDGNPQALYYKDYTLTRLDSSPPRLLEYEEDGPPQSEYLLPEGYYLLTSGTRCQDGSVLAHLEFFPMQAMAHITVPLVLPSADTPAVKRGDPSAEAGSSIQPNAF